MVLVSGRRRHLNLAYLSPSLQPNGTIPDRSLGLPASAVGQDETVLPGSLRLTERVPPCRDLPVATLSVSVRPGSPVGGGRDERVRVMGCHRNGSKGSARGPLTLIFQSPYSTSALLHRPQCKTPAISTHVTYTSTPVDESVHDDWRHPGPTGERVWTSDFQGRRLEQSTQEPHDIPLPRRI